MHNRTQIVFPQTLAAATLLALAGCSAAPRPSAPAARQSEDRYDDAQTASALVFDPPATLGAAPLDLSRDDRGPAAYAGFDEATTTRYTVYTFDHQTGDLDDRHERHAYMEKVGINSR